ncbi:FAD:protein FMN transferase [Halomonas sp. ANAO-440]|uniref:FAD:protein FMN transferase n=1 Tax=Halomonas sp. ANAO-440 TaxID=2861360 RepID=UPI001CAA6DDB|nr:FAD:protein FMN transferase [Halomonas sp. ANAO-440]MBZ0329170.1 FAD:protein FMN transferase [Halomonas sp. ANAO-440]
MISLASRRFSGLAHSGPALFMFLLMMLPMALLSACRSQLQEQLYQGTALGTGYHITLYADLDAQERERIAVGIQSELAHLQQQRDALMGSLAAAFSGAARLPFAPPISLGDELERLLHALAVDHLTEWLTDHDVENMMVEVGGVIRTRGLPPGGGWWLSLEHAGLPEQGAGRRINLTGAALVHRQVRPTPVTIPALPRTLGISVVADTASEASRQALLLMAADQQNTTMSQVLGMDSAARLVVKTPQGVEILYTAAMEPWLEY